MSYPVFITLKSGQTGPCRLLDITSSTHLLTFSSYRSIHAQTHKQPISWLQTENHEMLNFPPRHLESDTTKRRSTTRTPVIVRLKTSQNHLLQLHAANSTTVHDRTENILWLRKKRKHITVPITRHLNCTDHKWQFIQTGKI